VTDDFTKRDPWTRWSDQELLDFLRWAEERQKYSVKHKAIELGVSTNSIRYLLQRVTREGSARLRLRAARQADRRAAARLAAGCQGELQPV
jgi:transposase